MKFYEIEQNTDEWIELRKGKFTASTFKDLMANKNTIGYEKAIYKVVFERLTNESPENYVSEYMSRGHELEPLAVEQYEMIKFYNTSNGGFYEVNEWIGASPDRNVNNNKILEIKSPAYNTMIKYLLNGKLPSQYKYQVQGQLFVSEKESCDFMAYHPKLNPLIITIDRDDEIIDNLKKELDIAIEKARYIIDKLTK